MVIQICRLMSQNPNKHMELYQQRKRPVGIFARVRYVPEIMAIGNIYPKTWYHSHNVPEAEIGFIHKRTTGI